MQKVVLTVGHKVGLAETHTTESICATVTELMPVDGYTAIPCMGMWQGVPEHSTRIEFITDELGAAEIVARVPRLATVLQQEAIMCEVSPAEVTFPAAIVAAA